MEENRNKQPAILTQLLSGIDNQTHDIIRWLTAIAFFVAVGLTIYVVVVKDGVFNIETFCFAISSLILSAGGSLKLKETTEPGTTKKETKDEN